MKPTLENDDPSNRSRGLRMPKIDRAYRSSSIDDFGGRGKTIRFRDLSGGYFKHEAPRAFATEAAVFGAMLLTVMVPLINSASAVMELVRAFSV